MGVVMDEVSAWDTLRVREDGEVHYIQLHRPEDNNTINRRMLQELERAIDLTERRCQVLVLEGLPDVFCYGADFNELRHEVESQQPVRPQDPAPLYRLWQRLASGPFVSVAHVRGKVNAGGVGFVAACDVVLCEQRSTFALSEMLFGLLPACVTPFLVKRIGAARASYMTLMTQPISAAQALEWGLVDAVAPETSGLLRRHLMRLRRLTQKTIRRHKALRDSVDGVIDASRQAALAANTEVFSDQENMAGIARYARTGQFPWER